MASSSTSVHAGINAMLTGRNTTGATTSDILTTRSGYIVVAG
jgi:hypothetical protein